MQISSTLIVCVSEAFKSPKTTPSQRVSFGVYFNKILLLSFVFELGHTPNSISMYLGFFTLTVQILLRTCNFKKAQHFSYLSSKI